MQEEVWKDIPNYEGYYQVSNLGRVKSLSRIIKNSKNGRYLSKEIILKTSKDGGGYLQAFLSKNNKRKVFKVHKLVAMAFMGHTPSGYKEIVDHIDNNCLNNNLSNLQITSPRVNVTKDRKNKTSKYTGVYWVSCRKIWQSKIIINKKSVYLGSFKCEYSAHLAYQKALASIKY